MIDVSNMDIYETILETFKELFPQGYSFDYRVNKLGSLVISGNNMKPVVVELVIYPTDFGIYVEKLIFEGNAETLFGINKFEIVTKLEQYFKILYHNAKKAMSCVPDLYYMCSQEKLNLEIVFYVNQSEEVTRD